MRIFLVLLFLPLFSYAFEDRELDKLWSSIKDITQPTLEEWRKIENYLQEGERPYLKPIEHEKRISRIRGLKLVGPNNEMPVFEKIHLNPRKDTTNKRCVLLYGSYNGIYPKKVRRAIADLEQIGYSGDVLVRIGGFPNLPNGGLKLCFVPYAFKVAFLKEAQLLGYEEVLWLDCSLRPLVNPEKIFSAIKRKGYFYTSVGFLSQNVILPHLPEAAAELGVTKDLYGIIPHIMTALFGLNMRNPVSIKLLDDWLKATSDVYPCITFWPEELSVSILSWRMGRTPQTWMGNYIVHDFELNDPLVMQRNPSFYMDNER